MLIKKNQFPILIFTLIYLVFFLFVFIKKTNYEFLMYVGIIIFLFGVILFTSKKIEYPNVILWGLSIWGLLHMLGGGLIINGDVLYAKILIPIIGTPYYIFRYDQFVHIFGFAIATLLMFVLLKPLIKFPIKKWASISILIIMVGLGLGALNEIIEFIVTVLIPETGVGGFINSSLDLVSDLIGAIIAMAYIVFKKGDI